MRQNVHFDKKYGRKMVKNFCVEYFFCTFLSARHKSIIADNNSMIWYVLLVFLFLTYDKWKGNDSFCNQLLGIVSLIVNYSFIPLLRMEILHQDGAVAEYNWLLHCVCEFDFWTEHKIQILNEHLQLLVVEPTQLFVPGWSICVREFQCM